MNIAFVLFNGVTFLDFAGFYDVIIRLRHFEPYTGLQWDVCAASDSVRDDQGLEIRPGRVLPDLSGYDLVFVPGGWGTRSLRHDPDFVSWLKGAGQAEWIVSVCTGSLLLGAAGLLEGKKAVTHPSASELLEPYCREVGPARIVHDGRVITGGGVSTSIDLGLYVLGLLAGEEAALAVKQQIDYPYELRGADVVLPGEGQ
ncbi:DJ-1/PfpI family protein [Paenibacillus sp. HN-1]|uniref:DJ-1/PfpI family protein n=1 Tax=Paenibacillus TaxID=44249 RepID=UPI001CA7E5AD|nr:MULTISPECIES: DJ-1/PfpI family protein [Paenibacillus]MBY9079670.1 DJ-1/PfpI family protein [Paenibacillus sp. CGMCC 1.18879]MBY9082921.1 DJ-1/PfpI family protein [Paenibacillus sinensis]